MNLAHEKIIKLLLESNGPTTSRNLSQMIGISARSVKTHISQINEEAGATVINSGNQGYMINRNIAQSLLKKNETDIPQNFDERRNYIIREFLLKHISSLEIEELCNKICVSEATLRADIARMNRLYEGYKICFRFRKDDLLIEGPERSLRKMYSLNLLDNVESSYFDYDLLENEFPDFDIHYIVRVVRKTFQKHNYFINEFALFNLTLHIAVIIDRLKKKNYVQPLEDVKMTEEEKELICEICEQLEEEYNVVFTRGEQTEIYILFKSNANPPTTDEYEKLRELVGNEISDDALSLIEDIRNRYYVDLSNPTFTVPFALHLKNLIFRAKNGSSIYNPMSASIIQSQPIVFDIALFVAMKLMEEYDIEINEGEICFLALHIGGEIERQKHTSQRIKTVLLCPTYMDLSSQLYNKLLLLYSNEINIVSVVQQPSEIGSMSYDLLISTLRTESGKAVSVVISPFLSQNDKTNISDAIETARNRITAGMLKKHFDDCFEEELFFYKPSQVKSRDKAIRMLAENLMRIGYVRDNFYDNVMKREKAAATVFGYVAVPHSVEMDALKTSVSVLIDPSGIGWGEKTVNVVLMMSIQAHDHAEFTQLYEALIAVFSNEEYIHMICNCRTFKEYKSTLLSLID